MDAMAQQDKNITIDLIRAILARNSAALALGISLAAVVLGASLVLLVADHKSVTAVQADLAAERARMVTTIEAHAKQASMTLGRNYIAPDRRMIAIGLLFVRMLCDCFKSRRQLNAEIMVLRHQLNVLRQRAPRGAYLRWVDRALFIWLYRRCFRILDAITIVRPETVLRWHRMGFAAYWRWKSRSHGGRPRIAKEVRDLIRRMSLENPLWGATKIHGELLKVGIEVAQSTVSIYMVPRSDRPLQTWKTFLSNHTEGVASIDLFVVPTIAFQRLFAFLVLGHERRLLLWFAVTRNPTADWLARQITEAFPWDGAPKYLIRDNDRVFGAVFKARIRAMGIRDRPTSFRSPWQNGYVERLIGSIRRECTDHLLVFNAEHLRRILAKYATYYNEVRTHVSLGKDAPCRRPVERFGDIVAYPVLGGLHHRYARI